MPNRQEWSWDMQVGGIGNSGLDSHSSSHQITGCMHEHHTETEKTGGIRASSFTLSEVKQEATQSASGMSLMDTLKNAVSKGFVFLGNLWNGGGSGQESATPQTTSLAAETVASVDNPTLQQADVHQPAVAAAATAVQQDAKYAENPYFTTTSDPGKTKENLTEKIRIRLRDLNGQLTKRFGGRFGGRMTGNLTGKDTLDSGRRKSGEDLRKRSRYKKDDVEIDCVLTDDSYLMDSYDRRGEYSKLTTDYKGQDK